METWLINKSIVVIGGTTGAGLSAAQAFVRNGANVVVVGRNPESCLMAELNLGSNARAKQGDATQPQTALDAIQLLGGNGYINDYPTGRLLRDAKLYEIGAGTSEIRRMLIGRELFEETA